MISRVAEHCFWMSRYLERAENTARVLEVNQTLLLDFDVPIEQQWRPLLIISGIHDMPGPADAETVQNHMTWERTTPPASPPRWRRPVRTPASSARSSAPRCGNGSTTTTSGCRARRHASTPNRSEFYSQIKRINQLIHGISEAPCRTARPGSSAGSAVPGAGLPDGPHPRCEVPYPAADRRARRHAGRQRPLGPPFSRAARPTSRTTSNTASPTRASPSPIS